MDLLKNKHENELLQEDYNKFGDNFFEYKIVCECPKYMLNYYENKFINKFDSINNGYNKTLNKLPKKEQKAFSASLRKDGLYATKIQYNNETKAFYGNTEEEAINKIERWYFSKLYLNNEDNMNYDETNLGRLYNKIDALANLIDINIGVIQDEKILKEYLTVKELQSILKLSRTQTYELVALPDFPKIKIGGTYRIPQNELDKYLRHNLYKTIDIK